MIKIRPIQKKDRKAVEDMVRSAGVFNQAEIDCAMELIDECLDAPTRDRYYTLCAVDDEDVAVGFICFGDAPLTDGVYEVYWIAVRSDFRARGVASMLMKRFFEWLAEKKARMVVIETSSTPGYEAARKFYRRHGFELVAVVRDFYRIGDDKVILVKLV